MAELPKTSKGSKKGLAVIAEDSVPNAAALSIFVRQSGLEVRQFGDGQAAWEFIASLDAPALANLRIVFSDFMMPKMDGVEFLKRMKANALTKSVPFVFCSAVIDPKLVKDALALSNGYLVKPATLAQVLKKIQALVGDGIEKVG
jgi:adenylate cyclase